MLSPVQRHTESACELAMEMIAPIARTEVRVANPQHWRAGEHQVNVENLRQLRFRLDDQLRKLRQRNQPSP